jgi:hypothetical protein
MNTSLKLWHRGLAVMPIILALVVSAVLPPVPGAAAQASQRPISDFLSQQGTTELFTQPQDDQIGWSSPVSQVPGRWALFDYTNQAAEAGLALGTTLQGSVLERPLPDGRAEVTVNLHTQNALAWVIHLDPNGPPTQFNTNPLLLGYRAQDLLADPSKRPALGDSHLTVVFKNPALRAPLPDLVVCFVVSGCPGVELVSISFHGRATGPLHVEAGLGPTGTPGEVIVTQTGVLFRGPFRGATADGFPAERVELRRIGQ